MSTNSLITLQRRVNVLEQCQILVKPGDDYTKLFDRAWLLNWCPVKVLDSDAPEIVKVEPQWIKSK